MDLRTMTDRWMNVKMDLLNIYVIKT